MMAEWLPPRSTTKDGGFTEPLAPSISPEKWIRLAFANREAQFLSHPARLGRLDAASKAGEELDHPYANTRSYPCCRWHGSYSALGAIAHAFEVATIKLNRTDGNSAGYPGLRNGLLTARNCSLRMMLRIAYDLSENRIIGPDWLDGDRFDLAGKAPQGVADTELMPMLQTLLKDRFKVAVHREMKEMPVFDMVVAKGGLKISLSDSAHPFPTPPPNPGGAMNVGAGTMPQIAQRLTGAAGRPVLGKTSLEGRYGFMLIYTPLSAQKVDKRGGSTRFLSPWSKQLGLNFNSNREKRAH